MQSAKKFRIKKEDQVMVMAGREKGKTGKVKSVNPTKGTIFIEQLNMVKRHTKPGANQTEGGIIEKEAPMNISNVMLLCSKCAKPTRVGVKSLEDSTRVRFCKKCGEVLDK